MIRFVDEYRDCYGVEPICRVIEIAPSQYYDLKRRAQDSERRPKRERRDAALAVEVQRVHVENLGVYGARKAWKQLQREGFFCCPLYGRTADV